MSGSGKAERVAGSGLDQPELVEAWRQLAEARANPFLTPDWYRAWLQASEGVEPFVVVWRVNGAVRGVLPLARTTAGPVRLLRFGGAELADWLTPVCRAEDEAAMAAGCAAFLGDERRQWHLFELTRVDADCTWPAALWEAEPSRFAPSSPRRPDQLPFVSLGPEGYDGYLAEKSGNFRHHLRRHRRKLEREHGLEFAMTVDPDRVAADLDVCFALHEERWRERGGSLALSPLMRAVHHDFARIALERGWLRLWLASLDGEPAASWYGWRIGERYCAALTGLRFEKHSLGTVLFAYTIEQAAGEGAAIYDFLRGDEGYKARFETGRRSASSWVLGRRRHPLALASRGGDRLVTLARELPPGLRAPAKRAYRLVTKA
jgi:CelD/BcsL family acetyltransferase involved in cellulose biosynthesis